MVAEHYGRLGFDLVSKTGDGSSSVWKLDFREPVGRKLMIYANERTSKYLFGYRYIPANFDGILIGSSISDNWDISKIQESHVYNISIASGNITEERLVAENVFARGRMKLAIFCIHTYLTTQH